MATSKKPATWPQYAPFVAVFLWLVILIILVQMRILVGPSPPTLDSPDLDTIIATKRILQSTIVWSGIMGWIFTMIMFFTPFLFGFRIRQTKSYVKTGLMLVFAVPLLLFIGAFSLYLAVGGATPDQLAISLFISAIITFATLFTGIILVIMGLTKRANE